MRTVLVVLVLSVSACGGALPETDHPPTQATEEAAPPVDSAPPGSLWGSDVRAVVDAGLGRFLGNIDVEPVVSEGRFRGFRLLELRPAEAWTGVDLRPGDVVTSLNGMPIERETQAYDAFVALKTAKEIRVRYERSGEVRELVFSIVERGAAPVAPAAGRARTGAADAG